MSSKCVASEFHVSGKDCSTDFHSRGTHECDVQAPYSAHRCNPVVVVGYLHDILEYVVANAVAALDGNSTSAAYVVDGYDLHHHVSRFAFDAQSFCGVHEITLNDMLCHPQACFHVVYS